MYYFQIGVTNLTVMDSLTCSFLRALQGIFMHKMANFSIVLQPENKFWRSKAHIFATKTYRFDSYLLTCSHSGITTRHLNFILIIKKQQIFIKKLSSVKVSVNGDHGSKTAKICGFYLALKHSARTEWLKELLAHNRQSSVRESRYQRTSTDLLVITS